MNSVLTTEFLTIWLTILWRVVKRYFRYRGKVRPDMATGCPERLTLEFLQWIWNFKQEKRPQIIRKLEASHNLK